MPRRQKGVERSRMEDSPEPAVSSEEEWADARESQDEEAAAHHSEATARSIDDERERAANALQASVRPPPKWGLEEWEQKEAEMAREADLRRPPIASSTQLHHQRSDSAFSTAESSAISPGTGSTAATSSSRAAPAVHPDDFPAHRAAYEGDGDLLVGLLMGLTPEQKCRLDSQGNTVLHVAVLRRHLSLVERLLALGIRSSVRNARSWTPLDEAIALQDTTLVRVLHMSEVAAAKADMKAKRGQLLQTMKELPDYTFKLKWELGSPVFGRLLRQFAPHDTYEVWKNGTSLRVDGTLMGLDDKSTSLIPEWKRGHFSLLFDGSTTPSTLLFLDHRKCRFFDLTKERKKNTAADLEVLQMISEGPNKTKMKATEFRFKPVRGWLGGEQTETIEGWHTKVYEATGKMQAVTTTKGKLSIPAGASFADYLALAPEEDVVDIAPVDLLSLNPGGKQAVAEGDLAAAKNKKAAKQPRKMSGKCWMAADFPMSLRQLIPILDIVGYTNKHLARVGKFMHKYGDLELFPVKLQVPLLWTAYAQVSCRDFQALDMQSAAGQASFYQLPSHYTPRTLDDVAASRGKRAAGTRPRLSDPQLSATEDAELRKLEQEGIRFEL